MAKKGNARFTEKRYVKRTYDSVRDGQRDSFEIFSNRYKEDEGTKLLTGEMAEIMNSQFRNCGIIYIEADKLDEFDERALFRTLMTPEQAAKEEAEILREELEEMKALIKTQASQTASTTKPAAKKPAAKKK